MKKKGLFAIALSVVLACCIAVFVGCAEKQPEDTTPKEYTIQYTDDAGSHQITVTAGMPYALDVVPERTGYTFIGLFDAEVGGTQYVSSSGASLSPFTDGKNMVLFPQFKAKDYTVVLDYRGATVTGERQLTVAYGSSLPELPKNLTLAHKEFVGWFTKANCEGVQVADTAGLIPLVSVLNEKNFNLNGEAVTLYAGFEAEKFTVTCFFEAGMDSEEIEVEYDTPVSKIVPKTRVDGKAPLTWSKTQGGEVWSGKVTDTMVLYAVEYAPVIELDSNGGSNVLAIVARAGSTVALPTPTKELAKFAYWEDMTGKKYTSTTMPSKSISLKAVWQAKIELDENGGSDVDDISVAAGETITLPTPEKENFIFAGWYTAEKEQYTSTTMPATGLKLKAGWYKVKTVKKHFLEGNDASSTIWDKTPQLRSGYDIDFTELISELDWTKSVNVDITFHADISHYTENSSALPLYYTKEHFYYYSQSIVNDAYLVKHIIVDHGKGSVNGSYVTTTFSAQMTVTGGKIYAALASDQKKETTNWGDHRHGCGWKMKNFWAEIAYPDTANLYL